MPLWNVVRNFGIEDGELINEGMMIKFGKSQYKVEKLSINDKCEYKRQKDVFVHGAVQRDRIDTSQGDLDEVPLPSVPSIEEVKIVTEFETCKICLSTDNNPSNPLVNALCKCSGTSRAIHVECLQQWMQSKIKIRRRAYVTSYYWKPFHCEICKGKCPDTIKLPGGEKIELLDMQYPNTNYIVLRNAVIIKTNGNMLIML